MQIARTHAYIVICGHRSKKYRLICFCIRFTRQPYKCLCILIAPHIYLFVFFSLSLGYVRTLNMHWSTDSGFNWHFLRCDGSLPTSHYLRRWRQHFAGGSMKNSQACLMSPVRHAMPPTKQWRKKQQH